MSTHFGVLFLCLVLQDYLSPSSVFGSELTQSKCRIAGVVLVENQERSKKFTFTMAEDACQALGLQLASKAQVEKAKGYGYETCSYGWVLEKAGVIPRIQNNENCGKNKTGVLTWTVELHRAAFSAYCFNASDVRINSCKPELMVTQPPSTVVVPTSRGTTASTSLETESTSRETESTSLDTDAQTTAAALTSRPHVTTTTTKDLTTSLTTTLTTPARTPRSTTVEPTPMVDTEPPKKQENLMAQKTERVVFGGVPTTLLVLALLFFIAAVVLAICYIKKYKTHLLFTKKKEQKEYVEAKVFRDTSGAENTKEEERPPNGKEAESPWKPTGNSIEAEV